MQHPIRRLTTACALLLGLLAVPATGPASAAPDFEVPFPCGQVWTGQTRTNHSPARAIDFNRPNDVNDPVASSAAGTVVTVRNLGNDSYGKYVVVDHGGGWRTYYAHLNSFSVSVGQHVSKGSRIGTVGSTGGSTGPHLHYEQRHNGTAVSARFDGNYAYYWGSRNYTSTNACGSAPASGTVNTSGSPLTIRSGPGTGYSSVGSMADGTRYGITCQTYGSWVTGTYGRSNVWNKVHGRSGYASDAYTYTGSDGLVAPLC
jgi:murein DD-endopeptidase MepM/ murein hydrolase activator NlpD